ncbi:cyclin PHO80-like protein, partial [Mycena leptocephala]
ELLRRLAAVLSRMAAENDNLGSGRSAASTIHTNRSSEKSLPAEAPELGALTTASRTVWVAAPYSIILFYVRRLPAISVEAYLLRILKYYPTATATFLSLLVYFDHMSKLSEDVTGCAFIINSYNIHRLLIAGVSVASKFFNDVLYENSRWAQVDGLQQVELTELKLQFLFLNFRIVISRDEMQRY